MTDTLDQAKRALRQSDRSIFFLGSQEGARLVAGQGPWRGLSRRKNRSAVIFLQPFAEEMNRCRRLISLCQKALNDANICSLTLDYYGTGDSAGDFEDASLDQWKDDIHRVCDLAIAAGATSIRLVGLRFGALLAQTVAETRKDVEDIIAIQPQEGYLRAMRQFIRIATTSLEEADAPATGYGQPSPAKHLEAGATILVGGYSLTPRLYRDFKTAALPDALQCAVTAVFVGLMPEESNDLTASDRRILDALHQRANDVRFSRVNDVQIWHQGIPEEPRILPQTICDLLQGKATAKQVQDAA